MRKGVLKPSLFGYLFGLVPVFWLFFVFWRRGRGHICCSFRVFLFVPQKALSSNSLFSSCLSSSSFSFVFSLKIPSCCFLFFINLFWENILVVFFSVFFVSLFPPSFLKLCFLSWNKLHWNPLFKPKLLLFLAFFSCVAVLFFGLILCVYVICLFTGFVLDCNGCVSCFAFRLW